MIPKSKAESSPRHFNAPKIVSAPRRDGSLMSEINGFMADFAVSHFYRIHEASISLSGTKSRVSARKGVVVKPGTLAPAASSEKNLMEAMGWYWEPLLHDIAFFEQMRDSVSLIFGSYNKMADLVMDGFDIQSPDPTVADFFRETLLDDDRADFREVVRSAVFELLTLSNSYKRPTYRVNEDGKVVLRKAAPIRVTAMRKLLDQNSEIEGYVQLLHRPNEYIGLQGAPAPATFYPHDEIVCGIQYSHGWYAYGVPPLAALPFVVKMKLQMERDIAEMMHQHVPRIDVTYVPDQQMNQDQVDSAISDVKNQVASLASTDNFVHTPDTTIEYKGPLGKALDFTGVQNHIEEQHFYSLPLSPDVLGQNQNLNAATVAQRWHLTSVMAGQVRKRVWVMLKPILDTLCDANGIPKKSRPTFTWGQVDAATAQVQAQTEQYTVGTAAAKVAAGFIDQNAGARDATQHHKGGPVAKAAAAGPIPPPVAPQPAGNARNGRRTVSNPDTKDKGPKSDPNLNAPKPDQRPKGKRHGEEFSDIAETAISLLET